jgi:transcription elongation factor Elf1
MNPVNKILGKGLKFDTSKNKKAERITIGGQKYLVEYRKFICPNCNKKVDGEFTWEKRGRGNVTCPLCNESFEYPIKNK